MSVCIYIYMLCYVMRIIMGLGLIYNDGCSLNDIEFEIFFEK
jgi:hypothetical protein